MVRASETNACDTRIRAAEVTRQFSFPSLKTRGASVPRRFKQRKERSPLQARLFSSNAIPYASITLPRCRRCLSLRCLSFSFCAPSYFSSFSGAFSLVCRPPSHPACLFLVTHPSCRYFPIDWSARRHPSRRSVWASPLSLFSFYSILSLYDEPTRLPLSPATPLLLFLHFPCEASNSSCLFLSIRRGLYWSILYRF